jgi:hypothetical protein
MVFRLLLSRKKLCLLNSSFEKLKQCDKKGDIRNMDEKFLRKLIRNCFYQYQYSEDSIPLSEKEYKELVEKVKKTQQTAAGSLREVVEDAVYEYLTK